MSLDALRKRSRGLLHDDMARPAFYIPESADSPDDYAAVSARLHSKRGQIGDLPGTNLNYAEVMDRTERLVFLFSELPAPKRGALVVFSAVEGYWLDTVDPPDGITVTVTVTRASAQEMLGIPSPCDA